MRRIDEQQAAMIVGLIGELGLEISESALEKDCHVSAALAALATIDDSNFEFVFCGGTCLSKSYGIVERLSEDVDLKVIKKPGVPEMTKSALKASLSRLKGKVRDALVAAGFDAEQFQDDHSVNGEKFKSIQARDENKYIVFNVRYDGRFSPSPELRQRLQIELNYTSLVLPSAKMDALLLIDKLAGKEKPVSTSLNTVDLREAAVEKLLSFPRRVAMHMRLEKANREIEGKQRVLDRTLVRHIYDIHEIGRLVPSVFDDTETISRIMAAAMEKDAKDFANQHPQFLDAPVNELRGALEEASNNPQFKADYDNFVKDMVYGGRKPDFATGIATFNKYFDQACKSNEYLRF